jgi:hypothetical protein
LNLYPTGRSWKSIVVDLRSHVRQGVCEGNIELCMWEREYLHLSRASSETRRTSQKKETQRNLKPFKFEMSCQESSTGSDSSTWLTTSIDRGTPKLEFVERRGLMTVLCVILKCTRQRQSAVFWCTSPTYKQKASATTCEGRALPMTVIKIHVQVKDPHHPPR